MDEIDETELVTGLQGGTVINGERNGAKRAVPGTLLRKCCHESTAQADPRGLRLNNTVIIGYLDLAGFTVPFPLHFDACEFEMPP